MFLYSTHFLIGLFLVNFFPIFLFVLTSLSVILIPKVGRNKIINKIKQFLLYIQSFIYFPYNIQWNIGPSMFYPCWPHWNHFVFNLSGLCSCKLTLLICRVFTQTQFVLLDFFYCVLYGSVELRIVVRVPWWGPTVLLSQEEHHDFHHNARLHFSLNFIGNSFVLDFQ